MDNGLKIDLKSAETVVCEKCDNTTFGEVFSFKKVSKLLTGSSQDAFLTTGGALRVATSFTGFTLFFPVTASGTIKVYGYK